MKEVLSLPELIPEEKENPYVDEVLQKVEQMDAEDCLAAGFPEGNRLAGLALSITAIVFLLYTYYSGALASIPAFLQRALHLGLIFILCALIYPSKLFKKGSRVEAVYNLLFIGLGLFSVAYLALNWKALYLSDLTFWGKAVSFVVILVVLDMTRRSIGMTLVLIVVIGVVYAVIGPHLPDIIAHRGYSFDRILSQVAVGTEGLFGSTLGISSTYVAAFVFFASFLEAFGGLRAFMKLALSLAGGLVGGPAKIAVVASGFFAMISGSTVANVVSTGSITIPLMKRMGYPNAWAGAVEAVASTGGTITPPIMGATAFILAEFLGVPYLDVMKAAAIPALLYYIGLFSAVHAKSCLQGFVGLPKNKLPHLKEALVASAPLITPILILVYLLVEKYTAMTAALYASIALLLFAFTTRVTRPSVQRIVRASKSASKAMVVVSAACATAGIIIAILNLTGLGFKLSSIIVTLSGGNLLVGLLLTQLAAIILGMGLVTPATYALLAVLVGPGLINMGVQPMAAHMFIFFFAALAPITPPVALAAYAAAGLADDSPFKVGMNAVKLGLVAFFLPYFFVFSPSLLGYGKLSVILVDFITAAVGVYVLGFATQGYLRGPLNRMEQTLLMVLALCLIVPHNVVSLVGLAGLTLMFAIRFFKRTVGGEVSNG